jgi:hypothetical protein
MTKVSLEAAKTASAVAHVYFLPIDFQIASICVTFQANSSPFASFGPMIAYVVHLY